MPVRTARGAGLAAGRREDGRWAPVLAAGFFDAGFFDAGFFAVARAVVEGREGCFLALGDRVLEPPARDESGAALLLREPVGEDVRVAMPST